MSAKERAENLIAIVLGDAGSNRMRSMVEEELAGIEKEAREADYWEGYADGQDAAKEVAVAQERDQEMVRANQAVRALAAKDGYTRIEDAKMTPIGDISVVKAALLEKIAEVAIRFYDNLDIDRLDQEYFGSGSDGYQYRGLRDAIRAYRRARGE